MRFETAVTCLLALVLILMQSPGAVTGLAFCLLLGVVCRSGK
jgi:preprotein translocase subunit SecF